MMQFFSEFISPVIKSGGTRNPRGLRPLVELRFDAPELPLRLTDIQLDVFSG